MNTLLNFLIEASLALLLFYGLYHWLLRNETSFHFVRVYLLLSILMSVLLPLLPTIGPQSGNLIPSLGEWMPTYLLPEIVVGNTTSQTLSLSGWQLLFIVYMLGMILLLLRVILESVRLLAMLKGATRTQHTTADVIYVDANVPPFSFFRYIFISTVPPLTADEREAVLRHEQIHVQRYHSFDRLLITLAMVLFWFNPIVYLYKKALIQVHEFEADSRAVASHDVDRYCSLLAKVALHSAGFSIANHFSNSLTLKRIAMMKTMKHTLAGWKKALLIPACALVTFLIACEDQVVADMQQVAKQSTVVTDYPAEVQKIVDEVKTRNKNAEVQVIGIMEGDKTALDNLDKSVKASEIGTIHVIKSVKQKSSDFDSYVIIEKGTNLNQVASVTSTDGAVFTVVEETAQPVGGMPALYELISKNLQYPQQAVSGGVAGKVFVEFIVNENGALSDFAVLKGIGNGCDEEAVRALKLSPNWVPGKQNGKVVKQRMVLPITFAL